MSDDSHSSPLQRPVVRRNLQDDDEEDEEDADLPDESPGDGVVKNKEVVAPQSAPARGVALGAVSPGSPGGDETDITSSSSSDSTSSFTDTESKPEGDTSIAFSAGTATATPIKPEKDQPDQPPPVTVTFDPPSPLPTEEHLTPADTPNPNPPPEADEDPSPLPPAQGLVSPGTGTTTSSSDSDSIPTSREETPQKEQLDSLPLPLLDPSPAEPEPEPEPAPKLEMKPLPEAEAVPESIPEPEPEPHLEPAPAPEPEPEPEAEHGICKIELSSEQPSPEPSVPVPAVSSVPAVVPKEVSPPAGNTDSSFSLSPLTIKHTPGASQSPEQPHTFEKAVATAAVPPPDVRAPSESSAATTVKQSPQPKPKVSPGVRAHSQGAKRVSPSGARPIKMTKAHSLRMADTKKKVQVKETEEQKVFEQAKFIQSQKSRPDKKSPAPSTPPSVGTLPALQPQTLPQPPPPTLPKARYKGEVSEVGTQAPKPSRSKSTPQPKIRTESPTRRTNITSPVRMPTPVSPAGRYTAHPSDIVEGARRDITARLRYKRDDQAEVLQECIRQKEAAREERKTVLANLNDFLTVYAGESPSKETKRSPEKDMQDWERRRVVGKALFSRTSSVGSPPRGSETGTLAGSPARDLPSSVTELKAESWRESVKRHKQMDAEGVLQGGNRLFQQGVDLAREKKKWAASERTKSTTKRALESEGNLTFTPALSANSRAIEAAVRKNTAKDHKTRLVPGKQAAVNKKCHDAAPAFGRTTRAPEPAPMLNRSLSAPIPARVDKLARPKKTHLIEQVGHAFDELNGQWERDYPIDDRLLARRNNDMNGRGVSQYLHGKSVEKHAENAKLVKYQTQVSRSNSNVGRYISTSSRDIATKRKRERLEQLFYLLDVEGKGRVTQGEIEQAEAALKSVKAKISDPREASILQALTEAAEILSHDPSGEYTAATFVAALERKISMFGPMKFMRPEVKEAKVRPAPSFNPAISERSRKMVTRQAQQEQVHNRLYDIAAEQQAKREVKHKEKMESETVGMTFKPTINRRGVRRKPLGGHEVSKASDDVLAHIEDIVGEAATWLKGVGRTPGRSPSGRTPGRSPASRGRSPSKDISPISVSPLTPGVERSLHLTDLYTEHGRVRTRSLGVDTYAAVATQRHGQVVQFHDPLAMHLISPARSTSPISVSPLTEVQQQQQPPHPYTVVPDPPKPRRMKKKRVVEQHHPTQQISMSSLHTASVSELARAGKLLMQQQLEKHRGHTRTV